MKRLRPLSCCLLLASAVAVAGAQTDLDAFMAEVLAHRDDNWKKLQQYVLDERQSWDLRGPAHVPLWGDRREFTWFIQDGFFVRSPVRFNGVTISERERREYETKFLAAAKKRETKDDADAPAATAADSPASLSGLLSQTERPEFVSAADLLRFKFDAGHYALVGRERLEDREVLRIEYYPTKLFSEESRREQEQENSRPRERESVSEKDRRSDAQLMRLMNKTSRVTLWIDPASQQILKDTFDDLGWDFFPGQWLVQMDDVTATMSVGQAFPDVWLPRTVDMRAQMATAAGSVDMAFVIEYSNYRKADVSATIGIPGDVEPVPAALFLLSLLLGGQAPERIATIQVHGNIVTAEADVLTIAGVAVGDGFDATSVEAIAARLRASRRFESVEVLKRFASIADPSQIALVIVVHEGPVSVDWESAGEGEGKEPVVRKRRGPPLMYAPVLGYEDGYGLTYGLKTAWPHPFGRGSRVTVPLTWGGDKRAAVEIEQPLTDKTRVLGSLALTRRTNPFFEADDDRQSGRVRIEHDFGRPLRVGGGVRTEAVSFLDQDTQMTSVGADVVVDTRRDPMRARNAVYGRAAWDRLSFSDGEPAQRIDLDARGYLGLPFGSTLVGHVRRQDSDKPLPAFERPLFGGIPTVRGFAVGSAIGDTIFATSAELRVPLTSPLKVAQLGLSAFADAGAVYHKGQRLVEQRFQRGYGAGAWISATVFRLNIYVAHGVSASTRVHVETTLLF